MLFPANGPSVATLFDRAREAALARVAALSPVELRGDQASLVERIRRECSLEPIELNLARATRQPGSGRDARIYISIPLRVDARAGYRAEGRGEGGRAVGGEGSDANADLLGRLLSCRPQNVPGLPFNGFEGFVRDGAIVLTFDPAKDHAAAKTDQERIERQAERLLGLFRAAVEGLNEEVRRGDVFLRREIQQAFKILPG